MDNNLIRAYLFNDVVQLGFGVADLRTKKKWLNLFLASLREFWGISEHQVGPQVKDGVITGRIDNSHCNLWLSFQLRENGYLHVEFGHLDGKVLLHHSDPDYFVPSLDSILDKTQRNAAIGESSADDIKAVLDTCIFHPREHLHLVEPSVDHHARIGSGISNPLLYLFHLRYQLCPVPQIRAAERGRLSNLFRSAIENNVPIGDCDLMSTPVVI